MTLLRDSYTIEFATRLAAVADDLGAERQALWFRGFARWLASPARVDPILADRQRVRDRLLDEALRLLRLRDDLAARRATQAVLTTTTRRTP